MKIAIISNLFPPIQRGGAERIAKIMSNKLEQVGHDVFIISTINGKAKIDFDNNLKIYRFKPFNIYYYLNDTGKNFFLKLIWHFVDNFNLHSYFKVKKILKQEKPDLVITHNLKGLGFLTPILIKKLKLKHIHILHDNQLINPSGLLFFDQENNLKNNNFLLSFYQKINAKLFTKVDKVISPSNWLMNYYLDYNFFPNSKKQILKNPMELNKVILAKPRGNYLFVGQLEKHKGVDWLVEFWQKNNLPAILHIAGKGSLKIKESANVKTLGFLSQAEINQAMLDNKFLIIASTCYENSPTVIFEAYSLNLPVIATNIGGNVELVNDKYLFEPNNEAELLKVINYSLSISDENYNNLVNENQKYIQQNNNYIDDLLNLD